MFDWRTTMKKWHKSAVFWTLLLSFVGGIIITWPLVAYVGTGIPSSQRPEAGGPRLMIAGDHLQLMYHFQLMADFISGGTPWFHNLYEFNEGDDSARYERNAYYAPFSVFFALGAAVGGLAFGWNFSMFLSVWLGAWGTWLLARRFTDSFPVIVASVTIGAFFPYRLITLLHGSPTGFAMAYVPFMLFGLDIAIRKKKMWGGLLAGLMFLAAGWVDPHTWFFMILLAPFWCLFSFLYDGWDFSIARLKHILIGLSPCFAVALIVLLQATMLNRALQSSVMSTGRTIHEILLYSPHPSGLFNVDPGNPHDLIYVTWAIVFLVLGSILLLIWRIKNNDYEKKWLHLFLYAGLLAGGLIIMLLSLGPRMPVYAAVVWWDRLCRVIPPYGMIRQPAKIFAILPALLSVLVVLPFAGRPLRRMHAYYLLMPAVFSILFLLEVSYRISPTISLLDREQKAYAAVVANAERQGVDARAVAVVLWPGDTHWSSLYEYYAKMYRIKMLNGYRPHVSEDYRENIFFRLESLNQGYASDEQLEFLLSRGINHLLLHEDAFPEKVSPFGVAQTLSRFLRDPRFLLLERDRSVWAFEIMLDADSENIMDVAWDVASPTRIWDASRCQAENTVTVRGEEDVFVGEYVEMHAVGGRIMLPVVHTFSRDDLRLMMRLRGDGVLRVHFSLSGDVLSHQDLIVDEETWSWLHVPYPAFDGFGRMQSDVELLGGSIDFDYVFLGKGRMPLDLQPGESFLIPAPVFFRAGYTDLDRDAVILSPESVAADKIFYGPRLPLPIGEYLLQIKYDVDGYDGAVGSIGFRYPGDTANPLRTLVSGGSNQIVVPFMQNNNMSMTFDFDYNRAAEVVIQSVEVSRIE